MNNKVRQGFVVFQSEFGSTLIKVDSINRINIDFDMTTGHLIECVNVLINDEHWEAFDGGKMHINLEYELRKEILEEIANHLNSGCASIDFELLIPNCIQRVKDQQ